MASRNRKRTQNDPSSLNEEPTATKAQKTSAGKKDLLIDQLKRKYKILYDAVQPLPYAKDRVCCVDKIFIQGNIQRRSINKRGKETWQAVESYHDILNQSSNQSKRYVILGDPGYGKSTLSLQFLHDWCNQVQQSPLQGVDVVIFLRMRQLDGFTSMYQAIKQLLLPTDSTLTVNDIKEILEKTESKMIFFDGYEEYPEKGNANTDFTKILKMKMLIDTHVTVTTTSSNLEKTLNELKTQSAQFKLAGFTEADQEKYVIKAVVDGDEEAAQFIRDKLKETPILDDMCQIPLFFTIVAHAIHDDKNIIPETKSVTRVFRFMMDCFFKHATNKQDKRDVTFETVRDKLGRIAFERLSDQKIEWSNEFLAEEVGENNYNTLIRTGILTEEEDKAEATDISRQQKTTSFSHNLFCESYAAFYLVDRIRSIMGNVSGSSAVDDVAGSLGKDATDLLSSLDRRDLQYLFRFACGLDAKAGGVIIDYLLKHTDDTDLAILCILEFSGEDGDMTNAVKELTSRCLGIYRDDSKILQRAKLRLLEEASRCNIPISDLLLKWSFSHVDEGDIVLQSGLRLPSLSSLEKISINANKAELSEDDVIGLLNYGLQSQKFEDLWFEGCELPNSFRCDIIPPSSITRNIRVLEPDHSRKCDLQTGEWTEITEIDDIKRLCLQPVVIDGETDDSIHKKITDMLYVASDHSIPIDCLYLCGGIFSNVECAEIQLATDHYVPNLSLLERLIIEDAGEIFEEYEVDVIFEYLESAERLKEVTFRLILMPQLLSESFLEVLKSREGGAYWYPYGDVERSYELDLEKGHWIFRENSGSLFPTKSRGDVLTEEDHKKEKDFFWARWRTK